MTKLPSGSVQQNSDDEQVFEGQAKQQDEWSPGVGPWKEEHPDDPLPTEAHYDRELLSEGDRRNVVDKYRYWTMEAIVGDLDSQRHSFHVAIENWQHDLNIGSVVRTANAFAAERIHIIGRRRWNRRGAMVTDRYQHVDHHATMADFQAWAANAGLVILGIDNVPGSQPIETYDLPEKCVFVFGQEGPGLSQEAIDASADVLEIVQYGSTRSINASAAAAIVMHSWIRNHVYGQKPLS